MVHTLQIVDSVAASPNTRLDLNDDTIWKCVSFDAPPPRLRRAMSSNAMRDGVFVSSSQYEARRIVARFQVFRSSRDLAAVQLQTLARELDRTDNYLKLQHDTASKPVFFKLFRSDYTAVRDIAGQSSAYECEVELLAEPFALGLRETLGPFTVNNDPAHASNGCYVDLTGVIGDVAAPVVIVDTTAYAPCFWLGVRQHGTPSDLTFFAQAESLSFGDDTSVPGGGPDAAMSGTGTNNYATTSFATEADMALRLIWTPSDSTVSAAAGLALRGGYRLVAVVRRSDASSVIRVQLQSGAYDGPVVTVPLTTSRQAIDLGLWTPGESEVRPGGYADPVPVDTHDIVIHAARDSGGGSIDWDFLLLVPADEAQLVCNEDTDRSTSVDVVIDGHNESVYAFTGGDPFAGTAGYASAVKGASGGFPGVVPNQTNRFILLTGESPAAGIVTSKSTSEALTFHYWPRYLYIRPSAS